MTEPKPFDIGILKTTQAPFQKCQSCDQEFPLTRDHWHVDASKSTGFRTVCRECRQVNANNKQAVRNLENVKAIEKNIGDFIIRTSTVTNKERAVAHRELMQNILVAVGGPQGLAAIFFDTLKNGTNPVRAQLLRTLLTEQRKAEEMHGDMQEKPSDMTVEQLMERVKYLTDQLENKAYPDKERVSQGDS